MLSASANTTSRSGNFTACGFRPKLRAFASRSKASRRPSRSHTSHHTRSWGFSGKSRSSSVKSERAVASRTVSIRVTSGSIPGPAVGGVPVAVSPDLCEIILLGADGHENRCPNRLAGIAFPNGHDLHVLPPIGKLIYNGTLARRHLDFEKKPGCRPTSQRHDPRAAGARRRARFRSPRLTLPHARPCLRRQGRRVHSLVRPTVRLDCTAAGDEECGRSRGNSSAIDQLAAR